MAQFNRFTTVVGKGYDLVKEGTKEVFFIPDTFTHSNVADALHMIRNAVRGGYWFRMERLVDSVQLHPKNSDTIFPELKYIVFESDSNQQIMCLFSKSVNHDCFAQVVNEFTGDDYEVGDYLYPLSAGFTDLKTCYGRSETLNKSSRPEDTELLLNYLK